MRYTDGFGGKGVESTDVSYTFFVLDSGPGLVLSWPSDGLDTDVAATTEFYGSVGGPWNVTLPRANKVSPGETILFVNRANAPVFLFDVSGFNVVIVPAGAGVYAYVIDNTTEAGAWRSFTLGIGTSSADAASLAGRGLTAQFGMLAQAHPTRSVSADQTLSPDDLASLITWTGGAGTFSLPAVATAGTSFFFEVRNQGSGVLTIAANLSEQIDGGSSIQLQPSESCFIHAGDAPNWYTVGRGRSVAFNFTQLVKTLTGGSYTLTPTEAANVVQKYLGVLTSNQVIVLPPVVQVYYVSNQMTGAFTLTFTSPASGRTQVTVPPNQNAVLFCDGNDVINASTTIAGFAALTLAQGSATTPPLNFVGNGSTGIFQPSTGMLAVTCNGSEIARFTATGVLLSTAGTPATADSSNAVVSSAWVRGQGFIKSLTSAQVNTALGYTPANQAGDTFAGPIVINNSGSGDALNIASGTIGLGLLVRGRVTDGVGSVRFANNVNSVEYVKFSADATGSVSVYNNGLLNVVMSPARVTFQAQAGGSYGGSSRYSSPGNAGFGYLTRVGPFGMEMLNSAENAVNFQVADATGNLSARGTIQPGSDARWKSNVKNITVSDALLALMQLRPVTYRMHGEEGVDSLGFIAQEVAQNTALAQRVISRDNEGFYHLDYNGLFAGVAVPVMQELVKKVRALETRMEKLEQQIGL